MNIAPQFNHFNNNYSVNKSTPSFKAIPKAKYELFKDTGDVRIYELEKRDIPLLQNYVSNMDKFFLKHNIEGESRQQVIEESFNAGIKILNEEESPKNKSKVFMAVSDNKPCGIIIGNVPKTDKNGNLHYSSRKNHGIEETELDWLATWNSDLKGVGKALVGEYFISAKNDGFKTIYVRSEVPEKSGAEDFYKSVGFAPLSEEQRAIQRKNDNGYIIGDYDDFEDKIIPMKAGSSGINDTIKDISKRMKRKDIPLQANEDLSFMAIG